MRNENVQTLLFGSFLLVLFVLSVLHGSIAEANTSVISRNHMGVWFDYSVRYYEHEADNAYSKEDIAAMVNVISKRFGKIAIDNAPELDSLPPNETSHSRVLIPSVVAAHNKNVSTSKLEAIVTFGATKILKTDQVASFDVAKYMADTANDIFPGTVKTLMMFSGFSIFSLFYTNVKETVQQLKFAREKINNSSYGVTRHDYELAIFLDIKDCGHFKGPLGQKIKDVLPHVEAIAFIIRPNFHHMNLSPEEIIKVFTTKFEECEKKIKEEKQTMKIFPVLLWMDAKKNSSKRFVQFWELVSNWAKKNGRFAINFEAFDTPHGRLISDQGWWRLKDKSEHVITESAFVEKVEDANKGSSKVDGQSSNEESSDEYGESSTFYTSTGASDPKQGIIDPQPLYIALVLLCVICVLLVAVIVGLTWGIHSNILKQNHFHGQNSIGHEQSNGTNTQKPNSQMRTLRFEEDGESSSGSVLEIRDTTPIVTYRK